MDNIINYNQFIAVDIRIGTIISAEINTSLKKKAITLKIDFGDKIGIKKSSAQLTANYYPNDIINKQVAAVINFKPKQIGKIISEVLILGFPDKENNPVLISPDFKLSNGVKLF